jgi:hypothetical protein
MINIELMANPNMNLNTECDLSPLAHTTTEELHHEWCAEDAGLDAHQQDVDDCYADEGYGAAESDHVYGHDYN